jgi:hypothetical protein
MSVLRVIGSIAASPFIVIVEILVGIRKALLLMLTRNYDRYTRCSGFSVRQPTDRTPPRLYVSFDVDNTGDFRAYPRLLEFELRTQDVLVAAYRGWFGATSDFHCEPRVVFVGQRKKARFTVEVVPSMEIWGIDPREFSISAGRMFCDLRWGRMRIGEVAVPVEESGVKFADDAATRDFRRRYYASVIASFVPGIQESHAAP